MINELILIYCRKQNANKILWIIYNPCILNVGIFSIFQIKTKINIDSNFIYFKKNILLKTNKE